MAEQQADSVGTESDSAVADAEVEVDFGADLDEDMLGDEPRPPASDNSAALAPVRGAPDEPRPPASAAPQQVANITDLDQLDLTTASEREKHLIADYHRKTQLIGDQRRENHRIAAELRAREDRLIAGERPASQADDPLAPLKATLNEDDAKALDVIQELNRRTIGTQLEGLVERNQKVEGVLPALVKHQVKNQAEADLIQHLQFIIKVLQKKH